MMLNYRKEKKKYIQSAQRIFAAHIWIGCLIVNYKTKRRFDTLKGSQRMGDRRIFLKTFHSSLFNDDLTNEEPNFGRIHLAGQYL
jgi:hypothetical protein